MATILERLGFRRKAMPLPIEMKAMRSNVPLSKEAALALSINLRGISTEGPGSDIKRVSLVEMHPVAFWCVRRIAWAVASVPWYVVGANDQPDWEHPLSRLLENPNDRHSRSDMFQHTAASLAVLGNAYLTPISSVMDEQNYSALYALRADRMSVRAAAFDQSVVQSYDYTSGGVARSYSPREIIHLRHAWLSHDVLGYAAINSVWESAAVYTGFIRMARKILENAGGIPGMLVFSSTSGLSGDQRKDMQDHISRFRLDGDKFGELLLVDVADGDLKFVPLAGDINKLQPKESKLDVAREVCLAYGVPPLLYTSDGPTYSNYQEANRSFWLDTVIPGYVDQIASTLTRYFGVPIRPDLTEIPAMSNFNSDTITNLARADFLTINEKRKKLGYDPVPMGDRIIVNPAAVSLDTQLAVMDARTVTEVDPRLLAGILEADAAAREQISKMLRDGASVEDAAARMMVIAKAKAKSNGSGPH